MLLSKPNTVDAAIAPLLKAVVDLERVNDLCLDKQEANAARIRALEAENKAASAEQERAANVLHALRGITNPKKG